MTITLDARSFREAIADQLTSRGVGTVVQGRVTGVADADIPPGTTLINVFSLGSRGTTSGAKQGHLPRFNHSEEITIACTFRLPEGLAHADVDKARADAVDALEAAIFGAILSNRAFAEVAFSGYVVDKGGSIRAGAQRGELVIQLTSEWLRKIEPGPEPGEPDDILRSVLVQFDVVGPDGEHSTPPEPAHIVDGLYPILDFSQPMQARSTYYLGVI
jgi:hypothetical protein